VHGGFCPILFGCGKDDGPEVESAPLGWDEIEQLALGEMAMTWEEFMNYTPRVFANKVKGHHKAIERELQQSWEQTRWLAAIVINPHLKKQIKPKDLATFPWEQIKKVATKEKPTFLQILNEAKSRGIIK
jgi:hypothetical protein